MKKFVKVCNCDLCGKEITNEKRFIVRLGVGSWDDDDNMEVKHEKDLCDACYSTLFDLLESDDDNTVKTEVKRRSRRGGNKRRDEELYDKVWELHASGHSYMDICAKLDIPYSKVSYIIKVLRAEGGIERKAAEIDVAEPETKIQMDPITVDKEGFLII